MRLYRKLTAVVACVVLLAGVHTGITQDKASKDEKPKSQKSGKSGTAKKKQKEKNGKDEAKGSQDGNRISLPILKGHDAFGLKIPYFNTEGKLQMLFNIGKASRIDEDRVSMADMQLETYDNAGTQEMTIDLPKSVLDLGTRIITTDSTVKITRSDFEITGDSMEFNTETKRGRLAGNVRMLIYDLGQDAAKNAKDGKTPQ
jgi:hypothetical protein